MFVQFAELPVFDQDRAKAFYIDKFECGVVVDAPMGPNGWRWIELRFPGAETTLHFFRRKDEAPSKKVPRWFSSPTTCYRQCVSLFRKGSISSRTFHLHRTMPDTWLQR
jgi:hypothetical protein